LFKVDKDSWKCSVCSVRNQSGANKCAACETCRPGFEEKNSTTVSEPASGSSIGAGGFSFGRTASTYSRTDKGSSGFSFGASSSSAGFLFGKGTTFGATTSNGGSIFGSKPLKETKEEVGNMGAGTGFSFTPTSSTGISFGVTKKETKEETGHGTKTSANLGEESSAASPFKDVSKVTTSAGSSYPPMSTKAPTPFGSTKKPSGSSYPPLASKAPTPLFGAANKEGPKAPGSAESSYPPVSTKAPTPFGSAQKKPSGGNYPPMASKAPTPFGGVKGKAGSNLSSSSSPFFSLSSKALTPVGSFGTKPEDVAGDVPPKEANTNPFANLKLTASAPKPTTDANNSIFTFEAMGR